MSRLFSHAFNNMERISASLGRHCTISKLSFRNTLYPALRQLEEKQYLTSSWGDSESGGRRKYYEITEEGRRSLVGKLQEWRLVNRLISISAEGKG